MSNIAEVPAANDGDPFTISEYQAIQGNINDGIVNQVAGCKVHRSTDQAIPTGATTPITFTDADVDGDGMFDLAGNPARVTIQTPGWYTISGSLSFVADSGGDTREGVIRKNGTTLLARNGRRPRGTNVTNVTVCTTDKLVAGDYIELCAIQDSGGNLNAQAQGEYGNYLRLVRD